MVAFSFKLFSPLLAILVGLAAVNSSPTSTDLHNLDGNATLNVAPNPNEGCPAPPYFVVYSDKVVSGEFGPPPVENIKGFNILALSFLLTEGPFDKLQQWTKLTAAQRTSIKAEYAAAGIKIVVALFGSTDAPTSNGADPIATANKMAAFVREFDLDGVEVDYEDFNAINNRTAAAWLISFTQQLRVNLPQGQYCLSHAPIAPLFSPGQPGGAPYLTIDSAVGTLVDWYSIQFYNQGATEYTTCSGLLTASSSRFPDSALFQIEKSGVSLSKLVIGKPGALIDASNGFMPPATLAVCVKQAKQGGWNAGVMAFEYPEATSSWIQIVRSAAFPE